MSTPPANHRGRSALFPRVRLRTLAGGFVLAGALLFGLALIGGVAEPTAGVDQRDRHRLGPLTAVQPELRRALLSEADLPAVTPGTTPLLPAPTGSVATPTTPTTPTAPASSPVPPPQPVSGHRPLTDLCRVLFEDPGALAVLLRSPPQESSTNHTHHNGGQLWQVLSIFPDQQAPDAYSLLRATAASCERFTAALADGTVVTVLLAELTGDRRESADADEAYTMRLTVIDGEHTLIGWLALDRVGPVVSVLSQWGPATAAEIAPAGEARQTALAKVRALLRALRGG